MPSALEYVELLELSYQKEETRTLNTYIVTNYKATNWSMLTQGDHFEEHWIQTEQSESDFRKRLRINGLQHPTVKNRWIMPGAILYVDNRTEKVSGRVDAD